MLIQRGSDIASSEITPENLYHNRREFIKTASAALGIAAAGTIVLGCAPAVGASGEPQTKKLGPYDTAEKLTPFEDVTTYNNYYEFGVDKGDPAKNSKNFKPRPWTVKVEGLCNKPGTYAIDDQIGRASCRERV